MIQNEKIIKGRSMITKYEMVLYGTLDHRLNFVKSNEEILMSSSDLTF